MTTEWIPPPLPDWIRRYTTDDVAKQRVSWIATPGWELLFRNHARLLDELKTHAQQNSGLARAFVHDKAAGDPVELFLCAMAWGFGELSYGARRVADMMVDSEFAAKVHAIVDTVRSCGSGDGWTDLLRDHKISGLGMAYGTKLLYFAGYGVSVGPRPLILDARVRAALQIDAARTVPAEGSTVWQPDYERYLLLASTWAADPTWDQEPDVVELALFDQAGGGRPDPDADKTDADASPPGW